MAGRVFTKLAERLNREKPELGPFEPEGFVRAYLSQMQVSQWCFKLSYVTREFSFNSLWTASQLLQAEQIVWEKPRWRDWEVRPVPEPRER